MRKEGQRNQARLGLLASDRVIEVYPSWSLPAVLFREQDLSKKPRECGGDRRDTLTVDP